jgi:acyl transferase domain-containing protein
MMLEQRIIPPQVNFVTPNPKIPFDEAHLVVPLEPTQWPAGRPERVSVNSFGITGANAHIIVESAASHGIQPRLNEPIKNGIAPTPSPLPRLLMFSANTPESLQRRASEVQDYAAAHPDWNKDLSYTLGCRRTHLASRAFCITGAKEVFSMSEKIKQAPSLSFVFTGQGAQWPTMGKEIVEYYPEFKDDLAHLGNVLARLPHPPSWDLIDELLKPENESRLNEAEFAQPLCTAIQVALVKFLARMGILPSAVVGHSSGEIAAAYASGSITADEAIIIAYYRGRCALRSTRTGAMAAVGMGRAEATLYLEDGVVIACDNSPNSITLSGDREALNTVIEQMKFDDQNLFIRLLKTDGMAYHSHHMLELGSEYEQHLQPLLNAQTPATPFFSSVTGTYTPATVLGAEYWRQNLESPVKFFPAVKELIKSQQATDHLYLEIGPHSALAGPLRQIFKMTASKGRLTYLPTLIRGKNSVESILETCGQLYLQTVDINIKQLNPGAEVLTDLPVYPWQHDISHWVENRALKEWRTRSFAPHELLGSRILEGNDFEPTWRNMLSLKNALWLHDHKVFSDVVFPCAGYIAMVGEAVRQLTTTDDFSIRYLNIRTAMILNDDKTVEVVTAFKHLRLSTASNSEWYEFSIYSHNGNTWTKHCDGQVKGGKDKEMAEPQVPGNPAELPREISSPYGIFTRIGLHYGPTFQALRTVSAMPGQRKSVASLDPPPTTSSTYSLHPTTIDQCLQLLGLASADGLAYSFQHALLPTAIEQLYIQPASEDHGPMQAMANAIAVPSNPGDVRGDITIVEDARILLSIQGCKLSAFEQQRQDQDSDDRIAAARLSWRPDLDFIPIDSLMIARVKDTEEIRRMETYSFLCILEMQERIRSCPYSAGHFEKFRCWIDQIVEEGRLGNNRIVPNSSELVKLSAYDRLAMIPLIREQVKDTEFAPAAELVTRLLDNCVGVFNGETQILDVYLRDNGLTNLYGMNGDRIDSTEFFVTAGHTNPGMRILEIGAGTGGTTLIALQALTSINGEPMYANYT